MTDNRTSRPSGGSDNTLILRLDAPLMSFGGLVVDSTHPTLRFPIRTMLSGLLSNSLGLDRTQFDELEQVQDAFTFASRWDVEPEQLRDYHTADLGGVTLKMARPAWNRELELVGRTNGKTNATAHLTNRMYWADGVLTAALHFTDAGWLDRLVPALRYPARPLFYGRKTCIPASPVLRTAVHAESAVAALQALAVAEQDQERRDDALGPNEQDIVRLEADVPLEQSEGLPVLERRAVPARMDRRNGVHRGEELRATVWLHVSAFVRATETKES